MVENKVKYRCTIKICERIIYRCKHGWTPEWVQNIHTWFWYLKVNLRNMFGLRKSRIQHINTLLRKPTYYGYAGSREDKWPCVDCGMGVGYLYFTEGITNIWFRDPDWNLFLKFNFTESIYTWYYYKQWLKKFRLLEKLVFEEDD